MESQARGISVLLIEDDDGSRRQMERFLKTRGYDVNGLETAEAAKTAIRATMPDVIVSDYRLPGMDGLQFLQWLQKEMETPPPFILITAFGDVATAVTAMQNGAFHFLEKPLSPDRLIEVVSKASEKQQLRLEVDRLRHQLNKRFGFENLIGETTVMHGVFERIRLAAPTSSTVLITGESGTGKEIVARAIHQNSPRKDKPFVAINAAALPEGLVESELFGHKRGAFTGAATDRKGYIEAADGGTLFIDEIGDLPLGLQAKLLRVLEERTITPLGDTRHIAIDIRVVAATKQKLESMVERGNFREDLYYRLSVLHIILPPLSARRDDIPLLVAHFTRELARDQHREAPYFTTKAVELLKKYHWPGNIRELRNIIESIMIFNQGSVIDIEQLPGQIQSVKRTVSHGPRHESDVCHYNLVGRTMDEIEREAIIETLRSCHGNKTEAARMLGIGVRTIQRKVSEYFPDGLPEDW